MLLLVTIAYFVRRNVALIPGRQTALELAFGPAYDAIADVLESRDLARRFFPLLATTFIFIWIANAVEFMPGIGSIKVLYDGHEVPLLRSVNTDPT